MFEKLETCPDCGEELKRAGYDFQYCWICGWAVKERGPYAADIHEVSKRIDEVAPNSHPFRIRRGGSDLSRIY